MPSSSASSQSFPSPIPLRPASSPPHALSREVARAYVLTPPPEDDRSPSTTITLHGKCILKIREELDHVQSNLGRLEPSVEYRTPPTRSPSYQSWYDDFHGRLDDLHDTVSRLEDTVGNLDTTVNEMETGLGDLKEGFELMNSELEEMGELHHKDMQTVNEEIQAVKQTQHDDMQAVNRQFQILHEEIQAVKQKLHDDMQAVNRQLQQLQNASVWHRNTLVTRFHDLVTPLAMPLQNGQMAEQERKKKLKWYWKLHDRDRAAQLIQQHEFYQIELSDWLYDESNSSEDEDDDPDDLDLSAPLPNSLAEAVVRCRDRAVRALFSHLGLSYQHFENLSRLGRTQEPIKRGHDSIQGAAKKRAVRRGDASKANNSDLGSTTQPFTSPTQSPSS